MFERILITTDTSKNAQAGVRAGLELAAGLGVRPTVLYVIRDISQTYDFAIGMVRDELSRASRAAGQTELERVADMAQQQGIEIDERIEEGQPAETIVEVSKEFDLIVISTSGRGKIFRGGLGHVSRHVLRKAACPVMMVHAE